MPAVQMPLANRQALQHLLKIFKDRAPSHLFREAIPQSQSYDGKGLGSGQSQMGYPKLGITAL